MLYKLFKSNHPFVILLIPILGVLLWLPSLFNLLPAKPGIETQANTRIFEWVLHLFSFYPNASVIFALMLIIIQSYVLIRLNFKYMFIENKTYLPSVFFVVFASALLAYQKLHPLLIGNLFFLLALDKALLLDKSKNHFKRYYESGFFLGLGTLFYPNLYFLVVVIWLTLFFLRTFNWREWFASVLGIITPFLFYVGMLYLTDNLNGFIETFTALLFGQAGSIDFSLYPLIAVGFLLFVFLIAIMQGARVVGLKKISTRKYFSFFLLTVLICIGLYLFLPWFGYELLVIFAIPLSIICSVFFTDLRSKWFGEVLFTLILASIFVIIWF